MRLETHPDAAAEAQEAANYYEQRKLGLGQRFESAIEAAGERILNNPYLFTAEDDGTRFGSSTAFPIRLFTRSIPIKYGSPQLLINAGDQDIGKLGSHSR